MVRRGEHSLPRALFHDLALQHDHYLIGNGTHCRQIVRDEHVSQVQLFLQPIEQLQDAFSHQLVERGSHLVADNELRLRSQGAGNADVLFLAAGKFAW